MEALGLGPNKAILPGQGPALLGSRAIPDTPHTAGTTAHPPCCQPNTAGMEEGLGVTLLDQPDLTSKYLPEL